MNERFKVTSAVHLLLIRNNRILLLRRFNTGYEDGNYSVPAGHLDGGEAASIAMVRETLEETGLEVNPEDIEFAHVMHRNSDNDSDPRNERIDFFFTAKKYYGEPEIKEPNKCDELKWFDINNLPANMVPYVKSGIEESVAKNVYSEFGW